MIHSPLPPNLKEATTITDSTITDGMQIPLINPAVPEGHPKYPGKITWAGLKDALGAVGVTGQEIVTADDAAAFAVGQNGATNPAFVVDTDTASSATGVKVTSAAAASGVAVAAISSGTDESLTIDAKGSGTVTFNATATGNVAMARNTTVAGTVTVTSNSATALTVGRQGATTPSLQVDASTSSSAAGVKITGLATTAGATIAPLGSTNEPLFIDGKGSGVLHLGSVSTGGVKIGTAAEASALKGIYRSGDVAVTVPTIADGATDSVAVDVSGAFTMQPAVGDMVMACPSEALMTDALFLSAYVTATDTITVVFGTKEGGGGVTGAAKNFKFTVLDFT